MAKKEISEAAEKVKKAEKKVGKTGKPKSGKPNAFKRFFKAIPKFWKDFRGEIKKIVWPEGKTVLKSTGVVLVVVAIITVVIFLIDTGLSSGISALKGLAEKVVTDAITTGAATVKDITEAVATTLG